MALSRRFSVLFLIGGLSTWGSLAAAAAELPAALGLEVRSEAAIAQGESPPQGYAVIHVNARSGSDSQGDGTQLRPFKTITQALKMAEANTLILLAAGVYSADSGEVFPLALKPQVTVQGLAGPNTSEVMIFGHGNYYSPSSGLRNITVLGANNAGLANVTISNPHPEGTGLWIESGSPIILENAFFRNGLHGVYIAGEGTPVIRGNYFAENGSAGLVIAGPSSAQVQANVFENTGTGITVAPNATPQILDNRISRNLDGLIVHAEARPTLENNQISRNRRNSIVDYAAWPGLPAIAPPDRVPPPPTTGAATGLPPAPTAFGESPAQLAPPVPVAPTLPAAAPPPPVPALPVAAAPAEDAASSALVAPEPAAIAASPLSPPTSAIAPSENESTDPLDSTDTPVAAVAVPVVPAVLLPTTPETADLSALAVAAAAPALSFDPEDSVAEPDESALEREESALEREELALQLEESPLELGESALEREELAPELEESPLELEESPLDLGESPLDLGELPLEPEELATDLEESALESDEPAIAAEPEDIAAEPETTAEERAVPTRTSDRRTVSAAAPLTVPDAIELPVIPAPEVAEAVEPFAQSLPATLTPTGNLPQLSPTEASEATADSSRLRVPDSRIPVGTGGALPELVTAGAVAGGPPAPPSRASSLGLHYKVVVATANAAAQEQVRSQVPDAFRTQLQGRSYMQVGAYATVEEAEAQVARLNQLGLTAEVVETR